MLEGTPIVGGIPAMLPKIHPLLVRDSEDLALLPPTTFIPTILFFIYMLNIKIIPNIHFIYYLFCFVLFCFVYKVK